MTFMAKSLALFLVAGLCEIGGGYLVWQWWKNGATWTAGAFGAILLVTYGIVPTYQTAHFGRVYAAYGGMFIPMSLLWGWSLDHVQPDRFDCLGALICLAGVGVIMFAPR